VSAARAERVNDFRGHLCVRTERVAVFKHLRGGIEFVKELPRHASGKLLRRHLYK